MNIKFFWLIISVWIFYPFSSKGQIYINELQSVNDTTIEDFEMSYPDWIELYNASEAVIDLNGYGISDDSDQFFKWVFPDVEIGPGEYFLVFASGKDTVVGDELHTNFKIASSGEEIFIYAPSGVLLADVEAQSLSADQSWGRTSDGGSEWEVFSSPSPNMSNSTGVFPISLDKPNVSVAPGFYDNPQNLILKCKDQGATLLYSMNGENPTIPYVGNLVIGTNTVVKSKCSKAGRVDSDVKTDSYFINSSHNIPVMSLSFEPDDFYDIDSGIYVLGDDYEFSLPNRGANFWEDWEREVHFEYFVEEEEEIEQNVGVKIIGGWSRSHAMKSLRLIARKELGKETMDFQFFKEKPALNKFDQLILRNSGNDFNGSMWADALNHAALAKASDVDLMAYQPVAVYFNGVYKGLHNLRERTNPEYLGLNHDIDDDDIDFLEVNGGLDRPDGSTPWSPEEVATHIKQGSNEGFSELYELITINDMSDSSKYREVEELVDIDLFIDYFAAQIYHINSDWAGNNTRFWRSPDLDGKWRYIYYDTEYGMGIYGHSNTRSSFNELGRVINSLRNVHSVMLKNLLANTEFRESFINRSADLMNTIYTPTNFRAVADQLEDVISNEITKHLDVYPTCCRQSRVNTMRSFINSRPAHARGDYESQFGISQNTVTLNVVPQEAGLIKISTIIPDSYPWSGVYYNGVPVTVTAVANSGYEFSSWSGESSSLDNSVTLNFNGGTSTITANFSLSSFASDLKITEINYNSLATAMESDDWFEIYNNGNEELDLTGWIFKDGHPAHQYTFPDNTILMPGAYLVVARDSEAFTAFYPTISNVIGSFDFSLGNSGDKISLSDGYGVERLTLTYDDKNPWPELADGKGATLELMESDLDFMEPENWQAKCKNGSPGKQAEHCDCEYEVSLGSDIVACSVVAEPLSSELTTTGKDFFWFADGDLRAITDEYVATEINNFTLVVEEGGCLASDEISISDNLTLDLGGDIELCIPRFVWLDAEVKGSQMTYFWERDGEEIGVEKVQYVSLPGEYSLTVTANGCADVQDGVSVSSPGPSPNDDMFCEEDSVATASVLGDGDFEWYAVEIGGVVLGTESTLDLEGLVSDTTFYLEDLTLIQATGGKPTFESTNSNLPIDHGMLFTVHEMMTLKAVSAEATVVLNDLNFVVRILDDSNNEVALITSTLPNGDFTRVELNVELEPGDYLINAFGTSGQFAEDQLRYDSSLSDYPYHIGDIITITGNNQSSDDYYYFYNWEVEVDRSGCARLPVHLKKEDCLVTTGFTNDNNQVTIYPNPVFDEMFFSGDVLSVQLFTLGGIKLRESTGHRLSVSGFASGIYIVEVIYEEGKHIERIEVLN